MTLRKRGDEDWEMRVFAKNECVFSFNDQVNSFDCGIDIAYDSDIYYAPSVPTIVIVAPTLRPTA